MEIYTCAVASAEDAYIHVRPCIAHARRFPCTTAVVGLNKYKGSFGRRSTNLFDVLRSDLIDRRESGCGGARIMGERIATWRRLQTISFA